MGVGSSIAALPEGAAQGIAVLGAEQSGAGAGGLHVLSATGVVTPIEVPDGVLPERAGLGSAVSAAAWAEGDEVLIAAAATPGATVLVLGLHADGAVDVYACLSSEAGGFGRALAIGFIDDDEWPDIVVGSDLESRGRLETVEVYRGAALADRGPLDVGDGCDGAPEAPVEIACPEVLRNVTCGAGYGFGSAVAAGDVDADGRDDLIVGAPYVAVDGQNEAGAVYVFPGATLFDDAPSADVLTLSTPAVGQLLGRSVTAVRTRFGSGGRSEPVAGAPGGDLAAVFLCTGLAGDTPEIGERCLP
jgi:hypothetical protein